MTKKTSRQIALERRIAMSDGGKKSLLKSSSNQDRVRTASDAGRTTSVSKNQSSNSEVNHKPINQNHY